MLILASIEAERMLAGKDCLLSNSSANNHLMLPLVEVHYVHEGYVCLYV